MILLNHLTNDDVFSQPSQVKNGSKVSLDGGVAGSENSLLNLTDEDLWLRRGMDEDGSFREGRYAHQD